MENIIKIVPENDKERLNNVLILLPEKDIDDMVNSWLCNGELPDCYRNSLSNYLDYLQNKIIIKFTDNKINQDFKELNKSIKILIDFLSRSYFRVKPESDILIIDSEKKHDEYWYKKYHETEKISKQLLKKYLKFVKNTKNELFDKPNNVTEKKDNAIQKISPNQIKFDLKKSLIFFKDTPCKIEYKSYQYYICEVVFNTPPGEWAMELDITDKIDPTGKSLKKRIVYQAMRAINQKIERVFKIKDFMRYENEKIKIETNIPG